MAVSKLLEAEGRPDWSLGDVWTGEGEIHEDFNITYTFHCLLPLSITASGVCAPLGGIKLKVVGETRAGRKTQQEALETSFLTVYYYCERNLVCECCVYINYRSYESTMSGRKNKIDCSIDLSDSTCERR